ncbi:MAG: heme-binding protein, partial [Limisphaerales bacterium]
YAAMALARIGRPDAVPTIIEFIQENNDKDPFLSHAGIYALQTLAQPTVLQETAKHPNAAVRRAALLAMRRLQNPAVAQFLSDREGRIVAEAARAINDAPVNEALPKLAEFLPDAPETIAEPHRSQILTRAINANYRLGRSDDLKRVVTFAGQTNAPEIARVAALDALADWESPAPRDRVMGLWRPLESRTSKVDRELVKPVLENALKDRSEKVVSSAVRGVEKLNIQQLSPALFGIVEQTNVSSKLRVQALQGLASLKAPELGKAVALALSSNESTLRAEGVKLSAQLNPAEAAPLLEKLLASEKDVRIGQAVYATLGDLPNPAADSILAAHLDQLIAGNIKATLQLDLVEAARKRNAAALQEKLNRYEQTFSSSDPLGRFRLALEGGDHERGRKIFNENDAVGCLRCHAVKGKGGIVGPDLGTIGKTNSREFLMESLIFPNSKIAAGYENVVVTVKNGSAYAGIVKSETETELVLDSPEDGIVTVKKEEIVRRDRSLSAMPEGLENLLTKRDLRDLVEYLARLK